MTTTISASSNKIHVFTAHFSCLLINNGLFAVFSCRMLGCSSLYPCRLFSFYSIPGCCSTMIIPTDLSCSSVCPCTILSVYLTNGFVDFDDIGSTEVPFSE